MTSKVQPLMEAIHSNEKLHLSLKSLIMNSSNHATEDLRSILHYVINLLLTLSVHDVQIFLLNNANYTMACMHAHNYTNFCNIDMDTW